MAKNGITFYKTDPVYTNDKFLTKAVGKSELFTRDVKKTIGLTGKEIDENFLTLEGRDIYDLNFDEKKNLTLTTLNGDKYVAYMGKTIIQSDWKEGDKKSMAYINNKPEKVSEFKNDAGYTKTLFYPLIQPGEVNKKNFYPIGVISVNGEETTLYGKITCQDTVIPANAEFDEEIKNYRFDISDDKFEYLSQKNFLLMPKLDKELKPQKILVTSNGNIHFYTDSQKMSEIKIKYLDVITDKYKNSNVYFEIIPETPVWFICSTNENKEAFVYVMPMSFMTTEEDPKKLSITFVNNVENGADIRVYDIQSEIVNEVFAHSNETVQVLYGEKGVVKAESVIPEKMSQINCNWQVLYSTGETEKYENTPSISFSPKSDATVTLLSISKK